MFLGVDNFDPHPAVAVAAARTQTLSKRAYSKGQKRASQLSAQDHDERVSALQCTPAYGPGRWLDEPDNYYSPVTLVLYRRRAFTTTLSCAARAAPYSARKRFGSFFSVASNCSSACAGWLISSSIS